MTQLCEACASLNLTQSDFTTPPFEPVGRYHSTAYSGTFAALRTTRQTCDFCQLIWLTIEKSDKECLLEAEGGQPWSLIWSQSTNDYEPYQEYDGDEDVQDLFQSALFPVFGHDERKGDYGIQFIDGKGTEGFLRGRLVDPEVDVQMVKCWIDRCKALHGPKCNKKLEEDSYLTVIDTKDLCLVDLPEGEEYAALSYVWGESNFVVSLLSNVDEYRRPGGLNVKLPRTIRDAIDVCKALGVRYLWVDSLCITQDDSSTKQALIVIMDQIYTNATLTLVAATGDGADAGLSGWSDHRSRDQHCIEVASGLRLGILPYYQRELLECEHSKRAWTYQETTLSPRCLIFLNGFVYFNCNVDVYCEHTHAEVDGIRPENSAGTLGKLDAGTSADSIIQTYASHVVAFTARSLTYETDALNAFQGVGSSMVSRGELSSMHFGMPASFFDWALFWRCDEGLGKRRDMFPSWSWVSRQGRIELPQLYDDEYEKMWFFNATWVDWYAVREDGMIFPLWNSPDLAHLAPPEPYVADADEREVKRDESEQTEEQEDYHHDHLFARTTDWNALVPLPPPAGPQEAYRFCSVPRSLCLDAPVIALDIGARLHSSRSNFKHTLLDSKGRACGFLSIDGPVAFDDEPDVANLLVLSVTSFGDLSYHQNAGLTTAIFDAFEVSSSIERLREYLETLTPEINHDFLNVMYVKETAKMAQVKVGDEKRGKTVTVFERAGVGFVLREALKEVSDIEWQSIVLV